MDFGRKDVRFFHKACISVGMIAKQPGCDII
jgi:hypothetical protein